MLKILIAEDEPAFCNVLAASLTDKGYDVVVARDGEQALRLLRETALDLAILDLMMPKLNGKDLIAAVRTDERLAHLPIVVLTATSMSSLEEDVRPFVQAWLTKTMVDLRDVEQVVRNLTTRRPAPPSLGGVPSPES